jgi:palmitoyl-protein thioesterase
LKKTFFGDNEEEHRQFGIPTSNSTDMSYELDS